ncbi:hypothetical protein IFR05_005379 [Cadophora sp. M221]|nr:hypothetical protein IFR05_005379 [Cadophora sp. M221]
MASRPPLPPPPPPPLPAWVLAFPPTLPPPPYNTPSKPVFPSRRQQINKPQKQTKPRTSAFNFSDTPVQSSTPFPFLELPCEVRIMIYKYLGPSTKPNKWCEAPQRHDGPCYPEILSVSRFVHREAIDVFYNTTVYFEIDISNNGIFFLGQRYLLDAPLPPTVRLAQSMCIRIQLEWRPVRQGDFKNRVAEIFPSTSRLQNLQVYFQATSPAYIGREATPEIVIAALDDTLSPLQHIAKQLSPSFCINFEDQVHQGRSSLGIGLNEVVREYFLSNDTQSGLGDFSQ